MPVWIIVRQLRSYVIGPLPLGERDEVPLCDVPPAVVAPEGVVGAGSVAAVESIMGGPARVPGQRIRELEGSALLDPSGLA